MKKSWFIVNYNGVRLHDILLQRSCYVGPFTILIQKNYMYYNFCHAFELQSIFRNCKMNSLREWDICGDFFFSVQIDTPPLRIKRINS